MKNTKEKVKIEEKRIKLMSNMEKEIHTLERQIQNIKGINFKNSVIKNLKIGARALQFITPYVLIAGITLTAYTLTTKDLPFRRDEVPVYEHTRMEADNSNTIQYQKQFGSFEDEKNTLFYCSRWVERENGFYERVVQTYAIPYKSYEEVLPLLEQDVLHMESILGYPNSSVTEIRNNLTEEEKNEPAYMQATIYTTDHSKYIMGRQSVLTNTTFTLLYLLISLLIEIEISEKTKNFHMDIHGWISDINERYQPLHEDILNEELRIKLENYGRLGGRLSDEESNQRTF